MNRFYYISCLLLVLTCHSRSEEVGSTLEEIQNKLTEIDQSIQDYFYSLGPLALSARILKEMFKTDVPENFFRRYILQESPKIYRRKRESSLRRNRKNIDVQLKRYYDNVVLFGKTVYGARH